jgi:gamma-glutamylcyclotransferase (GGCT)/AIG2-like uncharacterized protein YtfP
VNDRDSYLFAYGTLMPGCAPPAMRDACVGMEVVGRGTVRGILYDFEQFPGLVEGEGTVSGVVLRVPSSAWTKLDEYEACPGPGCDDGLFQRVKARATLEDGAEIDCWLYVYARDLSGAKPVLSGRWMRGGKID